MSVSILRKAISVNARTQVRCTSLTAVASQSSPHFMFNVPSGYCSSATSSNQWAQSKAAPSLVLGHHCDVIQPLANIKVSMANTLSEIVGNGAFITTYQNQSIYCGEELASSSVSTGVTSLMETAGGKLEELSIWLISTLKRRKKMMNKHKLRKRRKKLRLKSKK